MGYGVFSHNVTAAILVSQNNESAAMLVFQTSPLGVELFVETLSFVPINLHRCGLLQTKTIGLIEYCVLASLEPFQKKKHCG